MKRTFLHIFLLVLLSCFARQVLFAQEVIDQSQPVTTEGTDFWVAYPRMTGTKIDDSSLNLHIIVTSSSEEDVEIVIAHGPTGEEMTRLTIPAGGGKEEYMLTPKSDPPRAYLDESEKLMDRSLHIYTPERKIPFSCFAYAESGTTGATARDATLLLPQKSFGTEYVIQTYPQDGKCTEFAVVAVENNTMVTIKPSAITFNGVQAGGEIQMTLNRGQSLLVCSKQNDITQQQKDTIDLSGSIVCADKPVAVFGANEEVKIPMLEEYSGDYALEQLPPITGMGQEFYIGRPDRNNMFCCVTALYDETEVTEYRYNARTRQVTQIKTTLAALQSLSVKPPLNDVISNIVIRSTQPILCQTYFTCAPYNATDEYDDAGNKVVVNWSDAANAMLTDWDQRVKDMTFYTKSLTTTVEGEQQYHYLQVTVPRSELSMLQLDGETVDGSLFNIYGGNNDMVYGSVPIMEEGYHHLTTTGEGFIGFVYGFAAGMSYLYTLGYRPNAHPDSLFIVNEEELMSKESYELERLPQGWYQRQLREWPEGEQRLDTAIVCDSTNVHFLTQIDRDVENFVWEIWDIKPDTLVFREEIEADVYQKMQHWEHIMAVDPARDIQPDKRDPFTDYEVRALPLRPRILCPDDSLYADTLRTVVRVLRAYNDTTRRIICTDDTLRFYNDSLSFTAPRVSYVAWNNDNNDSTEFIGNSKLCKRGENRKLNNYRFALGLGLHRFSRLYETQFGCDSLVILEVFVNATPDTTRIDTFIGHNQKGLAFPPGQNVMFAGQTISKPGIYIDHLAALSCEEAGFEDPLFRGCDSIIKLSVHLRDTLETFFCDRTDDPERYGVTWEDFVWTGHLTDKDGNDLRVRDVTANKTIYAKDIASKVLVGQTHKFHDYYTTADGCDSNYVLILTREKIEIKTYKLNRPNNIPYTWRYGNDDVSGQLTITPNPSWKDTTVYRQQTVTVPGQCPVIFLLEVTFRDIKLVQRDENICDVDTVMWRGKIYAGYKYRDKYPGTTFKPKQTLTPGFYEILVDSFKTVPTRDYYDSLYYLNLHVSNSYKRFDTIYMCDNEAVRWNGMLFAGAKSETAETVYRRFLASDTKVDYPHIFPTKDNCDSTCQVTFFIRPSYRFDTKVLLCGDEDYVWEGHSDSGRPIYNTLTGEAVSFGKGKLWDGSTDGEFILTDSLRSSSCQECSRQSCDSVYRLLLSIHRSYGPLVLDTVVCRSKDYFSWKGHSAPNNADMEWRFTRDTTNCADTLTTYYGCDSITILNLRFFDDDIRRYNASVCSTTPAFLMGTTGTYFSPKDSTLGTHFFSTYVYAEEAAHCPYREEWTVTVSPAYTGETNARYRTTATVCRDTTGNHYTWLGHVYADASRTTYRTLYQPDGTRISSDKIPIDVPGTYIYYDSLKTTVCPACEGGGCDSVWMLRLEVMPSYYHEFRYKMSEEETYVWEGVTYGGLKTAQAHDVTVTKDTVIESHHDLVHNALTCDSTVVLHLRVGKVYRDTTYDFVCDDGTYTWTRTLEDGTEKTICEDVEVKAGETVYYYDTYSTHLDFDSVFVLSLTGAPTYNLNETQYVCQDIKPYSWYGHDAATHLLYIDGEPVDNIDITETGWHTVVDSMTTKAVFHDPHGVNTRVTGCDSVWTLNLFVHPSYNADFHPDIVSDYESLCSNETFLWHRTLYVGTDYDNEANPLTPTSEDYDRLVRITPAELNSGRKEVQIEGTTVNGCDSILYLYLDLYKSPFVMLYDTIGDNDTIWEFGHGDHIISGRDFHVSDYTVWRPIRKFFYIDTLTTENGCDSIVHDSLVVAPSYRFVEEGSSCSTDAYDWRNHHNLNYQPSGFYYDSLYTYLYYADSTYVLDFTVIPNFNSYQVQRMCKNDTLDWQHKKIYYQEENENDESTHYIATYVKPGACDSTYELEMYYYNYYHLPADTDSVCRFDEYHWRTRGIEHTQALRDADGKALLSVPTDTVGWITIYDSLKTTGICQCDSTFKLCLYVRPAYHFYDTIEICSTDTARWRGREYHSDTARDITDEINYGTMLGCDSTYFLCVHVHQAYNFDDEIVVCASELPYVWEGHGQTINITPEQALTWEKDSTIVLVEECTTVHGCDSNFHHTVTIIPIRRTLVKDTMCVGDTLLFNGQQLTTAGTYVANLKNQWGCDSIVTIELATVPVTQFRIQPQPNICADDAAFDINYFYSGIAPVAYMLTFDSAAIGQGFISVPWTSLRAEEGVISVPLPMYADKRQYVRPNNYSAMLYFDNGYCIDSTLLSVPVSFSMRYPSWLMEQHWDDAIGILVEELNGGYSFYNFQWYKDDRIMYGETKPYLYCPQYLDAGSVYSVALTRSDDSLTFMTCYLQPDLSRPQELSPQQPYIAVVPTRVVHQNPVVNILCVNDGYYQLFDIYGSLYSAGRFTPGEHFAFEVSLPTVPGVYVFRLSESSGLERSVKVIVE